jgi:MFS family permease
MITEAITAPLYAPLADKVGRRPVIVVLLSFWAVGGVAFGLCKHVWSTVLTRGFRKLAAVLPS